MLLSCQAQVQPLRGTMCNHVSAELLHDGVVHGTVVEASLDGIHGVIPARLCSHLSERAGVVLQRLFCRASAMHWLLYDL